MQICNVVVAVAVVVAKAPYCGTLRDSERRPITCVSSFKAHIKTYLFRHTYA